MGNKDKSVERKVNKEDTHLWFALGAAFIATAATVGLLLLLTQCLDYTKYSQRPEVYLPLLCVASVIGLMAVLSIIAVALGALGLTVNNQALGLPEGSIRAMIALSLIVLFVVMSVFLYTDLAHGNQIVEKGITQAQLNAIPSEQLVSSTKEKDEFDVVLKDGQLVGISEDILNKIPKEQIIPSSKQDDKSDIQLVDGKLVGISQELLIKIPPDQIVSSNKQDDKFTVVLKSAQSQAAEDIAKQTITVAGTLVTAVAAFYFGVKSVAQAKGKDELAEEPNLSIIHPDPDQTVTTLKTGDKLTIVLQVKPAGESVAWDSPPIDDPEGTLMQVKPNVFEYKRGSANKVTLRFSLVNYPDVNTTLMVETNAENAAAPPVPQVA